MTTATFGQVAGMGLDNTRYGDEESSSSEQWPHVTTEPPESTGAAGQVSSMTIHRRPKRQAVHADPRLVFEDSPEPVKEI